MATQEELEEQLQIAQAKITELEKGGGGGSDLEAELEKLRGINKDLISQRDAQKLKEQEIENKRLEEQGEFKTLAEKEQEKAAKLENDLTEANKTLEKYKERDEAEYLVLEEKVPEGLRDSLKDLPLHKRLELAKKLIAEKPAGPGPKLPGSHETDTLQEQYGKAVESGDVNLQISLKRQIHEAQQQ